MSNLIANFNNLYLVINGKLSNTKEIQKIFEEIEYDLTEYPPKMSRFNLFALYFLYHHANNNDKIKLLLMKFMPIINNPTNINMLLSNPSIIQRQIEDNSELISPSDVCDWSFVDMSNLKINMDILDDLNNYLVSADLFDINSIKYFREITNDNYLGLSNYYVVPKDHWWLSDGQSKEEIDIYNYNSEYPPLSGQIFIPSNNSNNVEKVVIKNPNKFISSNKNYFPYTRIFDTIRDNQSLDGCEILKVPICYLINIFGMNANIYKLSVNLDKITSKDINNYVNIKYIKRQFKNKTNKHTNLAYIVKLYKLYLDSLKHYNDNYKLIVNNGQLNNRWKSSNNSNNSNNADDGWNYVSNKRSKSRSNNNRWKKSPNKPIFNNNRWKRDINNIDGSSESNKYISSKELSDNILKMFPFFSDNDYELIIVRKSGEKFARNSIVFISNPILNDSNCEFLKDTINYTKYDMRVKFC